MTTGTIADFSEPCVPDHDIESNEDEKGKNTFKQRITQNVTRG